MASTLRKLMSWAKGATVQSLRESGKRYEIQVPLPAFSATTSLRVCALPVGCKVIGMDICLSATLAQDGTNFWTFHLRDKTAGADLFTAAASAIRNSAAAITADVLYGHEISSPPVTADQTVLSIEATKNAAAVTTAVGFARIFVEEA